MSAFAPWRIVHHDLADPPAGIDAPPGSGGVLLVLWWRGVALGARELHADQLPLTAREVRAVATQLVAPAVAAHLRDLRAGADAADVGDAADDAAPLARLAALWQDAPAPADTVSVVVCTRDRPIQLAECLASLAELRPAPLEVVVVDNAPDRPETREACARAGVVWVPEPRPGLSVARNTGVARSRGQIVAFTDDDVLVTGNWIGALRAAFGDPAVGSVTGLVLPAELETEAQWLFETEFGGFGRRFAPAVHGPELLRSYIGGGGPAWMLGAGANMAFRRSALDEAGAFDERLGAGASGCSEDSEMWYRLLVLGWRCRYHPSAVVFHTHRREDAELERQLRAYMRGHVTALLVQHERHRHWGNLWRLAVGLPWHYARVAASALARGDRRRGRLLSLEVAGSLAGIGYYVRNRGSRGGRGE